MEIFIPVVHLCQELHFRLDSSDLLLRRGLRSTEAEERHLWLTIMDGLVKLG